MNDTIINKTPMWDCMKKFRPALIVSFFQYSNIIRRKEETVIISQTTRKAIKFWILQTRIIER
jgi:hypothetical protein